MPAINFNSTILRLIRDVNDIRSALRRVTVDLPLFDIANENTPAQLTANQNNYLIGNYDVLRLSSDANRDITGLRRGVKGRTLRIFNVGSFPITLVHQSGLSTAEYRFNFSNARSAIIPPGSNVALYYDATQERWVGGDTQSSGAVYAETNNPNAQIIGAGVPIKAVLGNVVSDQYDFIDIANNRVVIQFDGSYVLHYSCNWDVSNANRAIFWYLNTVQTGFGESLNFDIADEWRVTATYAGIFSAGDVIEVYFARSASANITADSTLVLFRIS